MKKEARRERASVRKNMIKAEHLVKRYGGNFALNDVSFEIGEGEIVGLLGPNGAGKSTAMNILTGYLAPTSGRVTVGGADVLDDPAAAKKQIGYLPEQPPLYPDMTVDEYMHFVYELKGASQPEGEHITKILDTVKLLDVRERLIRNLSKGYKQRVGIAGALVGDPKVVIFDEPTVGLDPKQIIEVRNLLRNLAKSHTVILSTHILAEVQSVCERVIIINRGKVIADEKTEDITRTIESGYVTEVKIVGAQKDVQSGIREIRGVKSVVPTGGRDGDAFTYQIEAERGCDVRLSVFRFCQENNMPLIGMTPVVADLETVFIRLVDKADSKRR